MSSTESLLATAAMNAYDQGTNPGIVNVGNRVGSLMVRPMEDLITDTIQRNLKLAEWNSASFSAVAYRLTEAVGDLAAGTTVIAYRGTDVIAEDFRDWSIWLQCNYRDRQAVLAAEFYRTVAAQSTGPIVPTGHSLGGGTAEPVTERRHGAACPECFPSWSADRSRRMVAPAVGAREYRA